MDDRRARARRPCRAPCRLLGEAGEAPRRAEVRDLSPGGVGLLCDGAPRVGDRFALELALPGTRCALALSARVVHAAEAPGGRWRAGCAFDRLLPDVLAALLR
jgi:hypothetical protein